MPDHRLYEIVPARPDDDRADSGALFVEAAAALPAEPPFDRLLHPTPHREGS